MFWSVKKIKNKKLAPPPKKQVLIGGRVDAIATCDGQQILVEIKNRMKRFFGELPLYEKVQTQVKEKRKEKNEGLMLLVYEALRSLHEA